jgi:hypothetical protein
MVPTGATVIPSDSSVSDSSASDSSVSDSSATSASASPVFTFRSAACHSLITGRSGTVEGQGVEIGSEGIAYMLQYGENLRSV